MVCRSSKIARTRAFLKSQVAASPAAASIEKSTPADVGAANSPSSSDSLPRLGVNPTSRAATSRRRNRACRTATAASPRWPRRGNPTRSAAGAILSISNSYPTWIMMNDSANIVASPISRAQRRRRIAASSASRSARGSAGSSRSRTFRMRRVSRGSLGSESSIRVVANARSRRSDHRRRRDRAGEPSARAGAGAAGAGGRAVRQRPRDAGEGAAADGRRRALHRLPTGDRPPRRRRRHRRDAEFPAPADRARGRRRGEARAVREAAGARFPRRADRCTAPPKPPACGT